MTRVRDSSQSLFDRRLRDARMRAFIGRDKELSLFRETLSDRAGTCSVIFVHGPGGIGKSTLLIRLADEAREHGHPVVSSRLDAAFDGPAGGPDPVVLIDDLDRWENPETWLRETLMPAYPAGTLFLVASRRGPSVEWRSELGWDDLLRPLALEPLSPAESAAILLAHEVPADHRESACAVSGGNPLALRVAAQTLRSAVPSVTGEDLHRTVALSIFDQLIGEIPSRAHRQALDVCAHAATTNENLLRAGVPAADSAALFTWLRDLPFIGSTARGLYPSEVVRNVVEAELRWRDAAEFAAMHERVKHHLIDRARSVAADVVLPYIADILYVQRSDALPRPVNPRLDNLDLDEHPFQPSDLPEVCELARQAEGAEAARIAEFWLSRQPEDFHVYRRPGDPAVVSFFGQLRLSHPGAEELSADPVVAAAWTRTQRITPLRAGEHLGIVRFTVDPACYYRPGATTTLAQMRLAASIICDDRMAWQVIACPDPDYWGAGIELIHPVDPGPAVPVGSRSFTLYSQYFGAKHITRWSDEFDDRMLARRPRSSSGGQERHIPWNRAEFDQEVRLVLRSWHRPDILADSRMATSRITGQAGDVAVAGLRRTVLAALHTIGNDPRQAKYERVLTATFIDGAATQEAAAERLDLPFSTYRRHLGRGIEALSTLLWKAETHGISLLD